MSAPDKKPSTLVAKVLDKLNSEGEVEALSLLAWEYGLEVCKCLIPESQVDESELGWERFCQKEWRSEVHNLLISGEGAGRINQFISLIFLSATTIREDSDKCFSRLPAKRIKQIRELAELALAEIQPNLGPVEPLLKEHALAHGLKLRKQMWRDFEESDQPENLVDMWSASSELKVEGVVPLVRKNEELFEVKIDWSQPPGELIARFTKDIGDLRNGRIADHSKKGKKPVRAFIEARARWLSEKRVADSGKAPSDRRQVVKAQELIVEALSLVLM